jgi:hypothetical protein
MELRGALEDNILTLLCYSEEHHQRIVLEVPPELFATRVHRSIAEAAIKYIGEFHKPPRAHIRDLFEAELNRLDDRGLLIKDTIAATEDLEGDLQPEFVFAQLERFIASRTAEMAIDATAQRLNAGDLEGAKSPISTAYYTIHNYGSSSVDLPDPWAPLEAPPFAVRLPPVIANFVDERSRSTGFDPAGFAWSAISACGAALDGSIRLELEPHYQVPPRQWVLLLGESGIGKSPILDMTWKPLERIQIAADDALEAAKAEWSAGGEEGPEPQALVYIVNDPTPAGLQKILARQNRGAAHIVDEYAKFIGQLYKFNSGKGSLADRAFYLQSWNGAPYSVERATAGRLFIRNLLLTITGGVQPERLAALGNLTDDGLLQRTAVIILRPPVAGDRDNNAPGRQAVAYDQLIEDLAGVPGGRTITLSTEARAVYRRVQERVGAWRGNNTAGPGFRTAVDKLSGVWGSLTLILGYVMHNKSDGDLVEIGEDAAKTAETLVFDNLLVHLGKFYQWYGVSGDNEKTRQIADELLIKERDRIVASDLTRHSVCRGYTLKQVQDAVSPLEAMGILDREPGPKQNAWKVNRRFYIQFAERGERERARRAQFRELLHPTPTDGAANVPPNPPVNEGPIYTNIEEKSTNSVYISPSYTGGNGGNPANRDASPNETLTVSEEISGERADALADEVVAPEPAAAAATSDVFEGLSAGQMRVTNFLIGTKKLADFRDAWRSRSKREEELNAETEQVVAAPDPEVAAEANPADVPPSEPLSGADALRARFLGVNPDPAADQQFQTVRDAWRERIKREREQKENEE